MMQQQQQEEFMRQQMMQQEQQRQQEEWMRQQQQQQWQQQQAMQAQPTGYGSNNPFAPVGAQSLLGNQQQQPTPQPTSSFLPVPNMSSISENQTQQRPPSPAQAPKPAFNPPPRKADTQHGELAGFLARGREDGMDTFGNMGNLRTYLQTWTRIKTDEQDLEQTIHLVDLNKVANNSSNSSSRVNRGKATSLSSRSKSFARTRIDRLSDSRLVML
jgi:hypothetical protein